MGGSSGGGNSGSGNEITNRDLQRAEQNRRDKERESQQNEINRQRVADKARAEQAKKKAAEDAAKARAVAFDQGGTRGRESPEYKMQSGSGRFAEVDQNVRIARDLEQKAKQSEIKIPGVTGAILSTVTSLNFNNQAKQLRSGGRAVFDMTSGDYQGVVNKGRYSGNPDYSPIGRTDGISKTKLGSITATPIDRGSGDNNTPPPTAPKPPEVTDPEVTPRITPEVIPDETILGRGRGTRRTKRLGQGGTIIEGYGALQRGKGTRSVV